MANHGRLGLVWFALATVLFLLVAGCNGFFPSANLTSITVGTSTGLSSVNVGSTLQMVATGMFDDNSRHTIAANWSVSPSDGSIATITAGGLVTGVTPGTASVTAASNGINGVASITVCGNITAITISPLNQTITLGTGFLQFAATQGVGGTVITSSVTWSSSNSAVATISNISGTNGKATLVGTGTTQITATSCTLSASTNLTVTQQ